ncbi:hypothetical protein ACLOJK_024184 [Asimina triloba]
MGGQVGDLDVGPILAIQLLSSPKAAHRSSHGSNDLETTLAADGSKTNAGRSLLFGQIWVFFLGEQLWPPAAFFTMEIGDLKSAWQDEEDGRPRSAGFPLAGGGLRGGSMGKMEHRISMLR